MPRSVAFFLVAFSWVASPGRPIAAQPLGAKLEPGSISGWVANTATGKPVERATVVLNGQGANQTATTNTEGRFAFSAVEPGSYTLGAVKAGFAVVAEPVLQGPGGRVSIRVGPGAILADLKLRLTPEAIISGHVTDESGDPLPGVSVRLMHPIYVNGQRQLQRIEAIISLTNDRGEFRLSDLVPGRYCLVTTGGNDGAAFDRYFPVFYPGTMDSSAATLLDIKPGTQLHDMNIILPPAKMTKLRGRAVDASTNQPAAGARILVSPKGSAFNSVSTSLAATNEKGEWEMSDVRPGAHSIGAELSRGQDRFAARISVDIPPTGMDNIQLVLTRGAEFTGTVRLEGEQGRSSFNPAQARVMLQAREYDAGTSYGALTPDGGFTIRNMRPAAYDAIVTPLPESLYLKSVMFERQEAINTGFDADEERSYRLDLTLSGDGAQLEGIVKDNEGNPSSGVTVLLAPADPAFRKVQRFYKMATTGHDGKYILKGIPPGGYLLYSWEAVDPGIWFEPEFLPRYEQGAAKAMLQPNDQKTLDLKLLTVVGEQSGSH